MSFERQISNKKFSEVTPLSPDYLSVSENISCEFYQLIFENGGRYNRCLTGVDASSVEHTVEHKYLQCRPVSETITCLLPIAESL